MKRREARQQAFVLVFEQSFSHDGMEQIIDVAEAVMEKPVDEFAAGAMLYVVVEELIPEMSQGRHSNLGTVFFAVGFSVMMALDVALG